MKKQLLILSFLGCGFAFSQNNLSRNPVNTVTLPVTGPLAFQFGTGFVEQLQNGSSFTSLLPKQYWRRVWLS